MPHTPTTLGTCDVCGFTNNAQFPLRTLVHCTDVFAEFKVVCTACAAESALYYRCCSKLKGVLIHDTIAIPIETPPASV